MKRYRIFVTEGVVEIEESDLLKKYLKVQVSQCSDMGDSRLGDVRTINDLQSNKDAEKKISNNSQ